MSVPLVLDLDDSVRGLNHASRIALADWQEAIRFGCSGDCWKAFRKTLMAKLPEHHGTILMGSGDFHHVSHLLLEKLPNQAPIDVVVFDNHPDNMRFPFGIHCGSWVLHAARLPQVRTIHVLGITSADVGWGHAWENHLLPLMRGKVHYWTTGVNTKWANRLGLNKSIRSFASPDTLIATFISEISTNIPCAAYISIDKDVLSPDIAQTNWDQGQFTLDHLNRVIDALAGKVVGSDITGEVSIHRYTTRWKRWLSTIDHQEDVSPANLELWQNRHRAVNEHLLDRLASASA